MGVDHQGNQRRGFSSATCGHLLIIPTHLHREDIASQDNISLKYVQEARIFWGEFYGWLKSKGSLQIMRIIWEPCSDLIVFSSCQQTNGRGVPLLYLEIYQYLLFLEKVFFCICKSILFCHEKRT